MPPAFRECETLAFLKQEYMRAVAEVNRLQALNIQALMDGKEFEVENILREARDRRNLASDALLVHLWCHHCSTVA